MTLTRSWSWQRQLTSLLTDLGTTGGDALVLSELLEVGLDELRAAFEGTLPALFD